MAIIHQLPTHLADLIAAGEVVERPASAAKELIENAIDAGASRIEIEMEKGGVAYLRVADNGCGMSPEDAPVAFLRHATSKVRQKEDLTAIGTLGFRGEALAAISAVSRIDLLTRQQESVAGLHLHLEAGEIQTQEEAGCPVGTTIIVRDLFFNTPARMKFLKKDFTEAGYILSAVQHAALSRPEIAFTLIRDGKTVFSTDGKGRLFPSVFAVFGKELSADMVSVLQEFPDGVSVEGYIVKPYAGRSNRSMQYFFVNGRYVKSRLLQSALEEAYKNAMLTSKYPSCALFLTLPLSEVDVNVHPAKTEVKFEREKSIFHAVYFACKSALVAGDNIPTLQHNEPETQYESPPIDADPIASNIPSGFPMETDVIEPITPIQTTPTIFSASPTKEDTDDDDIIGDFPISIPPRFPKSPPRERFRAPSAAPTHASLSSSKAEPPPPAADGAGANFSSIPPPEASQPTARVLGECFQTYLIAEDENELFFIDKHAAHERILFNKLRAETEVAQQELITPVVVELTGEETVAIQEQLDAIRQAGFSIDLFGNTSFMIRTAPSYLDAGDIANVIQELAAKALDHRAMESDSFDELLHMIACKAAIKAGSATSREELQHLCEQVLSDENVRSCPHGRPVAVRFTRYELDKLFKRVNP